MHDAGGLSLEIGLDEQHHAPVALGYDVLLGDAGTLVAAQGALHHVVEGGVGGAGFAAQAGQFRRCVVQHVAGGADGTVDGAFQVGQFGQVLGDGGQQGQVVPVGQGAAVPAGGGGQRADVAEFGAGQDAAQQGAVDGGTQVVLRAEFQGAGGVEQAAGLGGFLLAHGHVSGVVGGSEFGGGLGADGGTGGVGQLPADFVKFKQPQRALEATVGIVGDGLCFVRRGHAGDYSIGVSCPNAEGRRGIGGALRPLGQGRPGWVPARPGDVAG